MKTVGARIVAALLFFLLAGQAFAQIIGPLPPGSIVGAFTAGDLLAANSAGQAADSAVACATAGYCMLPIALRWNKNLVYPGSNIAQQNWIDIPGLTLSGIAANNQISPINIYVGSDTVDTTTNGIGASILMNVELASASGFTGNRAAIQGYVVAGGPQGGSGTVEMNGVVALAWAPSNLNGTGSSFTTYKGSISAGNSNSFTTASPSATYLALFSAHEFDVTLAAGSSAARKLGLFIVQGGNDAVRGAYEDAAIQIASQAASVTWLNGILLGGYGEQWPFGNDSTLITAMAQVAPSPGSALAKIGIDFSAVTFTAGAGNGAFKSNGFLVDPSGNITSNTISTIAGIVTAPGVIVGSTETGLYGGSTTALGITINGTVRLDYGITNSAVWTFNNPVYMNGKNLIQVNLFQFNSGTILSSGTSGTTQLGNSDAASPAAQTFQVQSVVAGNANTAGATFTISGSKSNGSGGGDMVFQTTLSSAGSGTQNTLATALTLKGGTQQVVMAAGVAMTGIANTTGTGYVCYNTVGGILTYEAATCPVSTEDAKNFVEIISPEEGHRIAGCLRPLVFTYKEGRGAPGFQEGFFAEDVARCDERLVERNEDGALRTVKYMYMAAVLSADAHYQDTRIAALEARLH